MNIIKKFRVEEKWDATTAKNIESMLDELYRNMNLLPDFKSEGGKFYVKINGTWKEVTTL